MGATPDFNRPAWNNPIDEDLDWIRDNFNFLLCMAANGSPVLPGWITTVDVSENNNYARPDGYVLTKGTRAIHMQMEWTQKTYADVSPIVTRWIISQVTLGYDDGVSSPGLTWFSPVSLTIESGASFTTTAKHFGNGDSPNNFYTLGMTTAVSPKVWEGGLIPSGGSGVTYQKLTLVFCFYPNEIDWKPIFGSGNQNFDISIDDTVGGLSAYRRAYTNVIAGVATPVTGSPTDYGGVAPNQWHSVMIAYDGDSTTSPQTRTIQIWIDGVELYNGDWGSADPRTNPMDYVGPCYAGFGQTYNGFDREGLDCYVSYIWANEEYLDPNTYWSSFFDGSNKPLNIGADGSGVTGSQPATYAPDGDLSNNRGSSLNWTEHGTVPNAPSSPTD